MRLLTGLVALLALGAFAGQCDKDTGGSYETSFRLGEIRSADAADRPETKTRAQQASSVIVDTLNRYYDTAFVKPDEWGNGTHAGLNELFSAGAQSSLEANLPALALADLAEDLVLVEPRRQIIERVAFHAETSGALTYSIADVVFDAVGTLKSEDGPRLIIRHRATFWFVEEGDGYVVLAYSAELHAETSEKLIEFAATYGDQK